MDPQISPSLPHAVATEAGNDVHLALHGGERPSVEVRFEAAGKQGYHLMLLTIQYFDGTRFVGAHQRFEEQTGAVDASWRLPPTPKGTDKVVVSLKTYILDEQDLGDDKRSQQWYQSTWGHFTTAQFIKGKRVFQTWTRPLDTDLQTWMADSAIHFAVGPSRLEVFQTGSRQPSGAFAPRPRPARPGRE